MTPLEPKVEVNGRYSVSEASTLLGIHRNTLRIYTNQGAIKCGFHKINMRKFYLGKEILRFWKSSY